MHILAYTMHILGDCRSQQFDSNVNFFLNKKLEKFYVQYCYARSKYSFLSFLFPLNPPFPYSPQIVLPTSGIVSWTFDAEQKKVGARIQRVLRARRSKTSERVPPFFLTLFELRVNPELLAVLIFPLLSTKSRQCHVIVSMSFRNLATNYGNLSSISYFRKLYAGLVRFVARYRKSVMCKCFIFVGKRKPAMKRCHIRRGLSRVCEESSGT